MRRQTRDFLRPLVKLVQRSERAADDGRDVHESLSNAVLGEPEDSLLSPPQHLFRFVRMLDRFSDGALRDIDEPAQQRLVAHNADVMLDARPLGDAVDQRRQIGDTTNRLNFFAPVQLLDQRDHVHRTSALLQVAHPRINAAMRVQREVVSGEVLRSLIVERIVQQNCAQDGALRLHAYGQPALQTVIGSRHLT